VTPDARLAGLTDPIRFRDSVQPKVYDAELMGQVGVASRGVSGDEAREALAGRYMYSDMPASLDTFRAGRTFAATRTDIESVKRLKSAYQGAVGTAEQASALAKALGDSAQRYMTLHQAMDPVAFRSYVESTPGEKDTLLAMQRLEGLLADVKSLGLPAVEYSQARAKILASLATSGLTAEQLAKALEKGT
jgi:hypothetical protein